VGEGEGETTREPIVDFESCSLLETALPPCLTSASQETTSRVRTTASYVRGSGSRGEGGGGGGSKKTYEPEPSILAMIYDLYERKGRQSVKWSRRRHALSRAKIKKGVPA
jgi:hypothetical protein